MVAASVPFSCRSCACLLLVIASSHGWSQDRAPNQPTSVPSDSGGAGVEVQELSTLPDAPENYLESSRPAAGGEIGSKPAADSGEVDPATYCKAVRGVVKEPAALESVCVFALTLSTKLPNVICERKTRRFWRNNHMPWRDEVTTRVAYRDGIEYDRDIIVGGKATKVAEFHRVGSTASGGEFAAYLQQIFSPASDAKFAFKKADKLHGHPVLIFEYQVEKQNNQSYYLHATFLDGPGKTYFPAYKGKLWIDKATSRLLRMEREATEMDPSFPITYASTVVDYSDVALGDGSSFVLPVTAEVLSCSKEEGQECAHNVVRFTDYHKFRATTRILTGSESTQ
jgi:hypothetical protein